MNTKKQTEILKSDEAPGGGHMLVTIEQDKPWKHDTAPMFTVRWDQRGRCDSQAFYERADESPIEQAIEDWWRSKTTTQQVMRGSKIDFHACSGALRHVTRQQAKEFVTLYLGEVNKLIATFPPNWSRMVAMQAFREAHAAA